MLTVVLLPSRRMALILERVAEKDLMPSLGARSPAKRSAEDPDSKPWVTAPNKGRDPPGRWDPKS